ncbi:MAG: glycosyltransferase family 39 protein [Isosphaeraceae bacterium]|nr:glycosyltransferase family 39 protein [Isosphaeraceae bacterium]
MTRDQAPEASTVARDSAAPRRAVVILLLLVHAGLLLGNLRWNFIVVDEVAHVPAGVSHWQTGSFSLDRVNPPLARMLAALPMLPAHPKTDYHRFDASHGIRREWEVGRDFIAANGGRSFDLICLARLPGVVWSLLGGWLVFRWARELYGNGGGYLALAVWCFDPTILAFAPVVTPDLPSAVAGLLATFAFRRYLQRGRWSTATLAGLALGIALLVKHTLVLLYGILAVLWLIDCCRRPFPANFAALGRKIGQAVLIVGVSLYTLNAGYGFHGTGRALEEYRFVSRMFTVGEPLQNRFQGTWLGRIPVPLPDDYLEGIDLQRRDFEGALKSYLNGRWSDHGWWYYYLEALALKEPVGLWILGLWALGMVLVRHPGAALPQEELFLVVPALTFFMVVSSQTGFSHHMRYVIPMYPFLIIGIGKLAYFFRPGHPFCAATVAALLSWAIAGSLIVYPHSLSYFNELAGGPRNGHAFLLDSNIDWGQDLLYLREWQRAHPESRPLRLAYFNAVDPRLFGVEYCLPPLHRSQFADVAELQGGDIYIAVSATLLMGRGFEVPNGQGKWEQIESSDSFDYLRTLTPVARAGYSILIYRITPAQARIWAGRTDAVDVRRANHQEDSVSLQLENTTDCDTALSRFLGRRGSG